MTTHRLPAPPVPILVLLVLGAAGSGANAQDPDVFDLFKPQLRVALESSGERDLREIDGDSGLVGGSETFRWGAASLNFNIPLGGTRLHPGGRLLGHQIFAHAFSSGARARMSFLPDPDLDLYSGGLGFTALMLTTKKRLVAASLFATVAEEEETLDDPDIRYTGLGLGSFSTKSALWIYGGAFTYQLGRPLLLPVFGGWGRVSPDWSLGGLVPFLFLARYQPAPRWNLDLFLKIQGNRFGYENGDDSGGRDFPGRETDLRLRIVQGRAGASFGWIFSGNFTLVGEAGILLGRRLVFAEGDDSFLEARADPAGYVRVLLRLAFGESLLDPERP